MKIKLREVRLLDEALQRLRPKFLYDIQQAVAEALKRETRPKRSLMLCNHANEVPAVCTCPPECECHDTDMAPCRKSKDVIILTAEQNFIRKMHNALFSGKVIPIPNSDHFGTVIKLEERIDLGIISCRITMQPIHERPHARNRNRHKNTRRNRRTRSGKKRT